MVGRVRMVESYVLNVPNDLNDPNDNNDNNEHNDLRGKSRKAEGGGWMADASRCSPC